MERIHRILKESYSIARVVTLTFALVAAAVFATGAAPLSWLLQLTGAAAFVTLCLMLAMRLFEP